MNKKNYSVALENIVSEPRYAGGGRVPRESTIMFTARSPSTAVSLHVWYLEKKYSCQILSYSANTILVVEE